MFTPIATEPRPKYRSRRAVRRRDQKDVPSHVVTQWTRAKIVLVVAGSLVLAGTVFLPVFLLESSANSNNFRAPVGLHSLVDKSVRLEQEYQQKGVDLLNKARHALKIPDTSWGQHGHPEENKPKTAPTVHAGSPNEGAGVLDGKESADLEHSSSMENYRLSNRKAMPLARGVAGLPMEQTPALVGAKPGHIECDVNVDDLAYWNNPQGTRDQEFQSPFRSTKEAYFTFEPDIGGWNNIRMSMETIFVMAAAMGRTLVLPPKAPMYLLGTGADNVRSFGNFFPLDNPAFAKHLKIITMAEFLDQEGTSLLGLTKDEVDKLRPVAEKCLHQPQSPISCDLLFSAIRDVGYQPDMQGAKSCFIFDEEYVNENTPLSKEKQTLVDRFCGPERKRNLYDGQFRGHELIHWNAGDDKYRLLNHFYTFLHFTNPVIDNYYKRFVRDFLHYKDNIYCAAGKIVHALNAEGRPWSSLHVRRGDLQYKAVKISAHEWYNNTKEIWEPNEILFIATDERNKTFFDPIKKHHDVRFLDDYWDLASLGDLESNFLGMVDTIVASHGRAFAGTWFSTFSGYITRMRGYLGHSTNSNWYSWLPRKFVMQGYKYPSGNYPPREWPLAWVAIDGDKIIEHEAGGSTAETTKEVVEHPVDVPVHNEKVNLISVGRHVNTAIKVSDMKGDEGFSERDLSRGVAGRPISETPALVGAKRGHIDCDLNVDSLAYWNHPQGTRDLEFESPFKTGGSDKYITFAVDRGGWNNVRMSMEIIFVFAAATGRTLVLPPKEPLYRLRGDLKNIHRGFVDFFPLDTPEFRSRIKTISMEEFVKLEGGSNGKAPIPEEMKEDVHNSAAHCDKRENSSAACSHIARYLTKVGHVPDARAKDYCIVFDENVFAGNDLAPEDEANVSRFCGTRKRYFWTSEIQDHPLIHFRAGEKEWRLLAHFYGIVYFTNPMIGNYFKRFVRDFLHYHDGIYCAAGKIVKALQLEGAKRGFSVDDEGAGGYSAIHARYGELQYKKVKLPAEEWYENTKDIWKPNEILYIATDERNKTFFDPLAQHMEVRFLDDYFELAGLGDLDPNYFGMIDTIVTSRGRAFAGTFFSTFTGYINRLRGYHGMSMMDSWYSWPERKTKMHEWETVDRFVFSYEWPDGWIGIDADVEPEKGVF